MPQPRVPRWYLTLGSTGVTLILLALLLAFASASSSTRPYSSTLCYTSGGLLDSSEGFLGHALVEVNVTLVNRGSCVLRVNETPVPPGASLRLEPGSRVLVEAGPGCLYCLETRGVEVVYSYALLSIPALILSVVGFALVLYASMRLL